MIFSHGFESQAAGYGPLFHCLCGEALYIQKIRLALFSSIQYGCWTCCFILILTTNGRLITEISSSSVPEDLSGRKKYSITCWYSIVSLSNNVTLIFLRCCLDIIIHELVQELYFPNYIHKVEFLLIHVWSNVVNHGFSTLYNFFGIGHVKNVNFHEYRDWNVFPLLVSVTILDEPHLLKESKESLH